MAIRTGQMVLVGLGEGGGGVRAICHSVAHGERRMGMARGESDVCSGTDVGTWDTKSARNVVWPAEGGKLFCPMCLDSKCSDFCGAFKYA